METVILKVNPTTMEPLIIRIQEEAEALMLEVIPRL
jgi:hypothetical protein